MAKLNRESAHVFREEVALERFKNLVKKNAGKLVCGSWGESVRPTEQRTQAQEIDPSRRTLAAFPCANFAV